MSDEWIIEPEMMIGEGVKDFNRVVSTNLDRIWAPMSEAFEKKINELWDYALRCAHWEAKKDIEAAYKRGVSDALVPVRELAEKFEAEDDGSAVLRYKLAAARIWGTIKESSGNTMIPQAAENKGFVNINGEQ